jgi:hypothetical protein
VNTCCCAGVCYDSKLLLKTAVVRINVQRTKKTHVIAALKKEIADCLKTGKDENARIKVRSSMALLNSDNNNVPTRLALAFGFWLLAFGRSSRSSKRSTSVRHMKSC